MNRGEQMGTLRSRRVSVLIFMIATSLALVIAIGSSVFFVASLGVVTVADEKLSKAEARYSNFQNRKKALETKIKEIAKAKKSIPPGYIDGYNDEGQNDGLAAKWVAQTCDPGAKCGDLSVYAYEDCPNGVYVDANMLSVDGSIVDQANGSIDSISVGQKATIVLESYKPFYSIRITKMECRQ